MFARIADVPSTTNELLIGRFVLDIFRNDAFPNRHEAPLPCLFAILRMKISNQILESIAKDTARAIVTYGDLEQAVDITVAADGQPLNNPL